MKKTFSIKAKIWQWPGNGGWHFVTLDKKLSAEIRSVYTRGFVPVVVRCGKSEWATSLFPHLPNKKVSKNVDYLICINKKILKNEGLFAGDEIKVVAVLR